MAHLSLVKTANGYVPSSNEDQSIAATHKLGAVIHADFKKMRNYKFHRKFFALLDLGFEAWEPVEQFSKYGVVEKNSEQFREDVTILAGFYEQSYRLDGSIRTSAKSISFGSMDEYEFSKLYSSVINVLLKKVLVGYKDQDEVEQVVNKIIGFC